MSLLRDSAIVGAATFLVGSVLMEINVKQEGEPVGWWPYAGTFIAGALGFYLLGATNVVKVKNAEDFEAMTEKEGIIVCDSCNTDVESDGQYGALTIECGSCGNTLYHDDSYDKFDMVDFYGAESFAADECNLLWKCDGYFHLVWYHPIVLFVKILIVIVKNTTTLRGMIPKQTR